MPQTIINHETKRRETVVIDVNVRKMEEVKEKAKEQESITKAMKFAGEHIAKGIKITRGGSIIIDSSNTDPRNI